MMEPLLTAPTEDLDLSLSEAKLHIPSARHDTVTRAALIDQARTSSRRVVGITAPAGYGKTTFMTEWARADDRPVAWVSLDRFDNDLIRLLGLVARAYERVDPKGEALARDIFGPGTSVLGRAAPRLATRFARSPAPFVLMVDDVHELRLNACQDVLGVVIDAIPPGSQIVTASRSEQAHLPRLRVRGEAFELEAADLAFDAESARQLFAAREVTVTSEFAADATRRTEGWPAGLHLAALIAKGGRRSSITGAGPYLAVYLYREAMQLQPKPAQRFLWRSAVLDHICGSLCDAVVDTTGAAEHLVQLEASGLFLIPLDRQRPYLQTHLTLAAIAERLFVSRNTVSSQVRSIYRKLGVVSRDEAVEHATTIGLLG